MKNLTVLFALIAAFGAASFASAQEVAIGVGERLTIEIKGVPIEDRQEVSSVYTVSDAGTIHLPYLKSDPRAAGYTASAVAKIIEKAYQDAEIYTNPTVVITMDTVGDNSRRVTVMGEVKGPRPVPYSPGMTLLEALSSCGGFTDFAKEKEVRLIRAGRTTIHDVTNISRRPELDVSLLPDDKVIVPQVGVFGR